MNEGQSLNNSFENELSFGMSQIESFHADHGSAGCRDAFAEATMTNNGIANGGNTSPTLTSAWLNDLTSFEDQMGLFEYGVNNEIRATAERFKSKTSIRQLANQLNGYGMDDGDEVSTASEIFTSKTAVANGLNSSSPYLTNLPCQWLENLLGDSSLIHDDFGFAKVPGFEEKDQISSQRDKKRNTTVNDKIDGFPEVFGEVDEEFTQSHGWNRGSFASTRRHDFVNSKQSHSPHFDLAKPKQSDTPHFDLAKPKQSDSPHFDSAKTKKSYTPHFDLTNLNQSDVTVTRRRRKRKLSEDSTSNADDVPSEFGTDSHLRVPEHDWNRYSTKLRKQSTNARSSTTSEDWSPAPSPMAEVPSFSPSDTTQIIADDDLIILDTKELNKQVKSLSKPVVEQIKHRRRTLKNRGYAKSCREKKITETSTLQSSNDDLEKELASKRLELQLVKIQRDDLKRKLGLLVSALAKRGVRVNNLQ